MKKYVVTNKDVDAIKTLMSYINVNSTVEIKGCWEEGFGREWFVFVNNDNYRFGGTGPAIFDAITIVLDKIHNR